MENISLNDIGNFAKIFTGNEEVYGQFVPDVKNPTEDKVTGSYKMVKKAISIEQYSDHLKGKIGLGIVPINTHSRVNFVVIDIDIYNENQLKSILTVIDKLSLPIVKFKSKSGGLHLYIFFNDSVEAAAIKPHLKTIVLLLGLPEKTEIFPKQTVLDKGMGNFINLPYFGGSETKQFAVIDNEKASLQSMLNFVNKTRLSLDAFNAKMGNLQFSDGPICLQSLFYQGVVENRNKFLFNAGVYLKAAHNEEFVEHLFSLNQQLAKPVPEKEVEQTIVKSLVRREYFYTCKEEPFCKLCDKSICAQREYGLQSSHLSSLVFGDFIQFKTDPPYYVWYINNVPFEFYSEDEFMTQDKFLKLCIRELHMIPKKLKQEAWLNLVGRQLENIIVHQVDTMEDISTGSMFYAYLVEFLEDRVHAETKHHLKLGKVYKDVEHDEYLFRSSDVLEFYKAKGYKGMAPAEMQVRIKKLGGVSTKTYIDGTTGSIRVWKLPFKSVKVLTERFKTDDIVVDVSTKDEDLEF